MNMPAALNSFHLNNFSPQKNLIELCKKAITEASMNLSLAVHTAILFGSCAKEVLKKNTDVDIILVSESFQLNHSERISKAVFLEEIFNSYFQKLETEGYFLSASLHLRTRSEFSRPSRLFWDMLETSLILVDNLNLVHQQFENTRRWLQIGKAHKETRGLAWTWIFDIPEVMGIKSWLDLEDIFYRQNLKE